MFIYLKALKKTKKKISKNFEYKVKLSRKLMTPKFYTST